MGKSNSSPKIPNPPNPRDLYKQGANVYLDFLPKFLQHEENYRNQYDPIRIQHQQDLQNQFGPEQYKQMVDAFKQLDPTYYAAREGLGNNLISALPQGGQPDAFNPASLGAIPSAFNPSSLGAVPSAFDPKSLGAVPTAFDPASLGAVPDFNSTSSHLSPDQSREVEQSLRGSQAARGNASGTSAGVAEAYATGSKGLELQQQRYGNALQNYQQRAASGQEGYQNQLQNYQQRAQSGQQGYQNQMQSYGQGLQSGQLGYENAMRNYGQGIQSGQLGYENAMRNYEQPLQNLGSFLGSPSMGQLSGFTPPVSADRSMGYVNPNAGFQGQQFGLQNYQNMLGASQLGQGSGGNSWMSALGGVGSIIGAIAPLLFSDKRLKTDLKKVGKHPSGVDMYEFSYKNPQKFRGVLAQDVKKKFPDSVVTDPASGYFKVTQEFAPVQVEAA